MIASVAMQALDWGALAPAALAVAALLVLALGRWPRAGTLLFCAAAYANLPVVLGAHLGAKQLFAAFFVALVAVPAGIEACVRRRGLRVDYPLVLMGVYLATLLLSTLVARDARLALNSVGGFVLEGLVVYFLILNAMRSLRTLRGIVWTLLAVAAVLSCLGLYQELRRDYTQYFWGLAPRDLADGIGDEAREEGGRPLFYARSKVLYTHRAMGPVGDANFFAQALIMLAPLALWKLRYARGAARLAAAGLGLLLFSGIFLTYSRGGALTLMLLALLLAALGYVRLRHLVLGVVGLVLLVLLVAPGYLARVDSVADVLSLGQRTRPVDVDPATRGRLTEMLAAMHVFFDHPLLGVGPGQFMPYYSADYMRAASVAFKYIDKPREAHSLYVAVAAEGGVLGFLSFFGIIAVAMWRLWRERQRWLGVRCEYADAATACLLSLVGYLGTSVFLHLAYQRYYWLFLGLAGATAQTLASEPLPLAPPPEASPVGHWRAAPAAVRPATPARTAPGAERGDGACCAS